MRIFITLFIIGLFIESVAFFVNQIENIPFAIKIISPKYSDSLKGLQKLESSLVIEPSDKGFDEFQEIFLNLLREQNPSQNIDSITVSNFREKAQE